jgi:hypothetical protein
MPDQDPPNTPPENPLAGTPLYAAQEKISKINVADEIKNSFLDYSMSVIISRALPDARDGLKPSQRRISRCFRTASIVSARRSAVIPAVIITRTAKR